MIVDTSAIMAVALVESDADLFLATLAADSANRMSAGSWIELSVVVNRRHPEKAHLVEALLTEASMIIEPVTVEQATIGRDAYRRFGQASRHPARLNFGDCFAYALAKASGEPLLFKGDDFIHTDIIPAL